MEFNLNSNEFLLSLDMRNATKEQKIKWLLQIIDNELDKPEEEIDYHLFNEATSYFNELVKGEEHISDRE